MDEWKPPVLVLAVCVVVLGAAGLLGSSDEPAGPRWDLVHHDSIPEGDGYRETWILLDAPDGPLGNLTVWVGGNVLEGMWNPGTVRCATFTAWYPEQDGLRLLELRRDGAVAWSGVFGSGAGTPTTPACQD